MSDATLIRLARRLDAAVRHYATLTDLDECDAACRRIDRMIGEALLMSPASHAGYEAKRRVALFLQEIGGTPDRVP